MVIIAKNQFLNNVFKLQDFIKLVSFQMVVQNTKLKR